LYNCYIKFIASTDVYYQLMYLYFKKTPYQNKTFSSLQTDGAVFKVPNIRWLKIVPLFHVLKVSKIPMILTLNKMKAINNFKPTLTTLMIIIVSVIN